MSEFKGTPGPWEIKDHNQSMDCAVDKVSIETADYFIAQVDGGARQRANSLLIAAAPDLLDALQSLKCELILSDVDMGYIESHFRHSLNKATAAIAKALGQ